MAGQYDTEPLYGAEIFTLFYVIRRSQKTFTFYRVQLVSREPQELWDQVGSG